MAKLGRSMFITDLDFHLKGDMDNIYVLDSPLAYYSKLLNTVVQVPTGFETDLASVPRVPIIFSFWGGRAHREAVLHDYLFRKDSVPVVSFKIANKLFYEAMACRKKSMFIRYPMWWGVCAGGHSSYHKKLVYYEFNNRRD